MDEMKTARILARRYNTES